MPKIEYNEMVATLRDAVARLNDLGIEYMVTGSVAMSSYITARTTMDIDIIVEISGYDPTRFERRFRGDYYVDEISIRNAQRRNSMFNVFNLVTGVKVDFIIRKPNQTESAKFERRHKSKLADVEFWVIDKSDLILSKLDWAKESHSELQFRDIRNLIESGVDQGLIASMIKAQGLDGAWGAFLEWKTRIAK